MPYLSRPCGTALWYTVRGYGKIPVLCIAPGGMRSSHPMWDMMPFNPVKDLSGEIFRVIAMDQRNAGRSQPGALGEGWATYAADQLALLDHLGVDRCLTIGSCIGPSYQLRLMKEAPGRFAAAVLMQPIGISHCTTEKPAWEGTNREQTRSWFRLWASQMLADSRATMAELDALNTAMFEDGAAGFCFSVRRHARTRTR